MYEGIYFQSDQSHLIVQLHPGQQGLEVDLPEGLAIWPYEQINFSKASQNRIALSLAGQTIMVSHPELLQTLAAQVRPSQQEALQSLIDQHRSARIAGMFKVLLLAGMAGLLLLTGGYLLFLRGRDLIMSQIPVSWEAELGQKAYQQALTASPVCQSGLLTAGINRLQQQLQTGIPDSPYHLQFQVVQSRQVNAFALPGGFIALNSALIAQAPSAEAVLGVMAHESEHVLQRHGLKGLINQLGMGLALPLLVGDAGSVMGVLTTASLDLVNLGFDRSQESEADKLGLQLLQQAQINPQGMQSFFSWMAAQEAGQKQIPEFLSTHPLSSERLKAIQQTLANLPPKAYTDLKLDWPKIRAAASACTRGAP